MHTYKKHLYMTVFPVNALIASQLDPAGFGKHYAVGSNKHYNGKVIFAELDINFRNDFFAIDEALALTVPHPEHGEPKRTKFIASYAVLENVPLTAIKNLYLVTSSGLVLELEKEEYTAVNEHGLIRLYQEISPLETLVASNKDQREFGKFITRETKSKGAPKICFTQIDFNIDEFFKYNEGREVHGCQLPNVNPYRLRDCIEALKQHPEKLTKTVSLGSVLKDISYSFLRHGIWFVNGDEMVFFKMPCTDDLKDKHLAWWKAA
ncbi:MAG TPA: hypothetical protein PKN86_04835 [Candidatus Obscuribacter sp.]|nr:hypothetical protein [Candidatus Obscuribacter sp.]HNM49000.1 hypothetical protein [Candidatus Obscuribacter sp.]